MAVVPQSRGQVGGRGVRRSIGTSHGRPPTIYEPPSPPPPSCIFTAGVTAQLLASRGVKLDIVLDEGSGIARDGFTPYTTFPVALVGTAEKGYGSIQVGCPVL